MILTNSEKMEKLRKIHHPRREYIIAFPKEIDKITQKPEINEATNV